MVQRRRSPPAWFIPALVGGMFLAVVALTGLGALLYDPPHERVQVGERSYVIPPDHLLSLTEDPLRLRIRPPDKPFHIVYDASAAGRHDRTGVPHIFSVNDHGEHNVSYGRDGRSLVVCRHASNPAGGCGTWIDYGGATWSVLFPEARRGEADALAREATDVLRKYDTKTRRLVPKIGG